VSASSATCSAPSPRPARFGLEAARRPVDEGPVAEQAAHIAGFNILECADLDEAIEVASKNPGASFGILELRRIEM